MRHTPGEGRFTGSSLYNKPKAVSGPCYRLVTEKSDWD